MHSRLVSNFLFFIFMLVKISHWINVAMTLVSPKASQSLCQVRCSCWLSRLWWYWKAPMNNRKLHNSDLHDLISLWFRNPWGPGEARKKLLWGTFFRSRPHKISGEKNCLTRESHNQKFHNMKESIINESTNKQTKKHQKLEIIEQYFQVNYKINIFALLRR